MTDELDDLFPDAPVTLAAQVQCVKRELRYRERVYGRRVTSGHMTQAQATREIRLMEAVLETLKGLERSGARQDQPADERRNVGG